MPEGLIELIKQVLLSWQVIFITIAFFLWYAVLRAAVAPRNKPQPDKSKKRKSKRPKEPPSVPKNVDTGDLGLSD